MRPLWKALAIGLALAVGAMIAPLAPRAGAADGITIALDPGHGGSDPGASANGLVEKDLTLAVGRALKAELETYQGVRVHMTREDDSRPSENISQDLSARVASSVAAGASALVSLHFNSGSAGANGAEVWYPNASSYNYSTHTQGAALATAIQNQLTSLGLADRGTKTRDNPYYDYPDGSTGDYYAISRHARLSNLTGIIVEHAFLTSASDAARLREPGFVQSLAMADAAGIAQALGLSKGTWHNDGGRWRFGADGKYLTGWFSVGGVWYWGDSEGYTVTGWQVIGWRWYYFDGSTAMQTGWRQIDGAWYYLGSSGAMTTGWAKDGGAWYHLGASGRMDTGWIPDGWSWYYLDPVSGAMRTGWVEDGGRWFHLGSSGSMTTGWLSEGGSWYYLDPGSGAMATGTVVVDGRESVFAASGEWLGYASGGTTASDMRPVMAAPTAQRAAVIASMVAAFDDSGHDYPASLAAGGAPTINDFAAIAYDEAVAEGVSPELVFTQAMKETGWLGFGGDVSVDQFNFAGIGAVGGGAGGASFPDVRTGLRAQVQHLRAYADAGATAASLANPLVDPRFSYVTKGSAPYVEYLGAQENPNGTGWATARNYGYDILAMMKSYFD
ncbi:N-acetylmuramoyl-L-alanine amidase [Schaalia georgiae]|nr:N-acetylmuramoyl-L-alanine amidase [Schaalia georgiae]